MNKTGIALAAASILVTSCASLDQGRNQTLVKYSYTGPAFTEFTGVVSPWTRDSRVSGYFIVPKLPASTTTDFLDPDIDWPYPNLPKTFFFTDGARSISQTQIEDAMKDTGLRIDPNIYEVRAFSVRTDAAGDIVAWDVLFVHDVRRSTFLSAHNGSTYGQELIEVDATHFGCVATEKCTAAANFARSGPQLPGLTTMGSWTREVVK